MTKRDTTKGRAMKDWKFIQVGNETVGPNWDKKRQLEEELRGWMTMVNKLDGEEKRNAEKQIADIRKELNDIKTRIAHGENKKACNSLTHDYHNKYPNDPIYADMKSSATLEAVKKEPWRVYDIIGVGDSIARERIFEMIEEKYKIDYNDIYEAWLGHSWDKAVQKKSMDEAKRLAQKLGIKIGNESIDKQEWSMFKGLTKKAEEEVGNTWEWNVKDSDVIDYVTGVPSATTLQRLAQKHLGTYDTRSVQAFLVDRNSDKWAVVKAGVKPTVKSTNKVGNAEPKLTDMTGKNGSGVVERMSNLYFVSYNLNNGEKGIEKFPTESQAIAFLKKKIGNGKVYNARSKEQLLADVRELTKYIKDNPDRPCEKEKRLLGEAKEELDKRYGVIVGNAFDFETQAVVDRKEAVKSAEDALRKAEVERNKHRGELYWEEAYITAKKDLERAKENLERAKRQKTGNKVIDLRDPDPTGEIQASGMKRYYQLMDEYEKKKKKVNGVYKDKDGKKFHVHLYGPDSGYNSGNYGITGEGLYSITKVVKELPRGFVKIGNADTVSEYNAEIQRLTKKAEQLRRMGQGRSAMEIEKQIEKLGKELRELGNKKTGNAGQWNSTKTIYGKWDDKAGRPAEEYARITWLGQGKGGLVNIWRGNQMTSEKYGSNDLKDLRRWAEQRIGNEKISYPENKLESASWTTWKYIISNPDKYDEKTVEKARKLLEIKTGNETLGQWAKAKPRIINNLHRARNAMAKNKQITLWDGNDSVLISEDGTVQYLESNSFEVDRGKYDSQQKAVEELTKQGYRKK